MVGMKRQIQVLVAENQSLKQHRMERSKINEPENIQSVGLAGRSSPMRARSPPEGANRPPMGQSGQQELALRRHQVDRDISHVENIPPVARAGEWSPSPRRAPLVESHRPTAARTGQPSLGPRRDGRLSLRGTRTPSQTSNEGSEPSMYRKAIRLGSRSHRQLFQHGLEGPSPATGGDSEQKRMRSTSELSDDMNRLRYSRESSLPSRFGPSAYGVAKPSINPESIRRPRLFD